MDIVKTKIMLLQECAELKTLSAFSRFFQSQGESSAGNKISHTWLLGSCH